MSFTLGCLNLNIITMKDNLTFNFGESKLISKGYQIIKIIFNIIFFGFYYYCLFFPIIKFNFSSNNTDMTASQSCGSGFLTFLYPIFIIILTILYLVCISVYSKNIKYKSLFYKLVLCPFILLTVYYLYNER